MEKIFPLLREKILWYRKIHAKNIVIYSILKNWVHWQKNRENLVKMKARWKLELMRFSTSDVIAENVMRFIRNSSMRRSQFTTQPTRLVSFVMFDIQICFMFLSYNVHGERLKGHPHLRLRVLQININIQYQIWFINFLSPSNNHWAKIMWVNVHIKT